MPLITMASPKGGVGKTTMTANLANALRQRGERVLVLDLDSQNGLRLHFASPLAENNGFCGRILQEGSLRPAMIHTASGVFLIPFGAIGHHDYQALCDAMRARPHWFGDRVQALLAEGYVILADMPPGSSVWLDEVGAVADMHLAVLLSDVGSSAVLPRLEQDYFPNHRDGSRRPVRIILNQVDVRLRLNRDVATAMTAHLGKKIIGQVHRDESFAEAVGSQTLIADYAPSSRGAHDLAKIAEQVQTELRQLALAQTSLQIDPFEAKSLAGARGTESEPETESGGMQDGAA